MILCKYCNKFLNLDCFNKNKKKCKECVKLYNKQYNIINAKKISIYNKDYKLSNKKEIAIKKKKYDKKYRIENKEIRKEYQIKFLACPINKLKIKNSQNKREKERIKTDPNFRIKKNISKNVNSYLKKNNSSKKGESILKYLPYTIQELKINLENQFELWMNWNNQGVYNKATWNDGDQSTWVWQIDHIIPHSTFNYSSMEDQSFKECWALSNLRPYSAKQNILDGASRIRHIKLNNEEIRN